MYRILVIFTAITLAPALAAVKREEYSSGSAPNGGSASSANSQPVYSPSSPSSSSSSSASSNYNSGSPNFNSNSYSPRESYSGPNSGSQYGSDHSASASSPSASYQSQPSSQGNLYYYYYPVQEKPKDAAYHASSSNQYASAVNPNFASSVGTGNTGESGHTGLESAASGQDLSYSAQDISYSAPNMGQNIANEYNSQSGASYDQQLSNLATQLQQYGFGSNPSAFNSGSQGSFGSSNYDTSATNYGSSASSPTASFSSGGDALHSASSHPSYTAAAAASSFGSQNGNQIPFNGQTNGFSTFTNGQPSYANYGSASGQQPSYEQPSSGLRKYGLSSILMPMLALAGLSLLIPTVTSLSSSGRRKRAIDDNVKDSAMSGYIDRLERYYSIYRTAVEKEECMNRIICELGDAMSGVRGKSTVLTVMEKLVPTWMVSKMGVFKNAALSAENGKCKKYIC